MSQPAVITWAEDILFPSDVYRERVCRAGARMFRLLLGVDAFDGLYAIYSPGAEASTVRTMLALLGHAGDERLVRKISEAMALHRTQIPLFEDAVESFGLLKLMGVPVGMIGEGNPRAMQGMISRIGGHELFRKIVVADPETGPYAWQDALLLLEIQSGINPEKASFICADLERIQMLADLGRNVYYLSRESQERGVWPSSVTVMRNLYELPEALGLIAWEPPSGLAC